MIEFLDSLTTDTPLDCPSHKVFNPYHKPVTLFVHVCNNPLLQIAQNNNGFLNMDASGKPFGYGTGLNLAGLSQVLSLPGVEVACKTMNENVAAK